METVRFFGVAEPQFEGVTGLSSSLVEDMLADGRGRVGLARELPHEEGSYYYRELSAECVERWAGSFGFEAGWWFLVISPDQLGEAPSAHRHLEVMECAADHGESCPLCGCEGTKV